MKISKNTCGIIFLLVKREHQRPNTSKETHTSAQLLNSTSFEGEFSSPEFELNKFLKAMKGSIDDKKVSSATSTCEATSQKVFEQTLDEMREELGKLDLPKVTHYLHMRLHKVGDTRMMLDALIDHLGAEEKSLTDLLKICNEISIKKQESNSDPKKVLPRRNSKIAQPLLKLVGFLQISNDPFKDLSPQEIAEELRLALNMNLDFKSGEIVRMQSGCIDVKFADARCTNFSHVVDVFGIHWQIMMECSLKDGVVILQPVLLCLGCPGRKIGRKEHLRALVGVRGKLEITIDSEEEITMIEYFDFREPKIQFSGRVIHKILPVMKFQESALCPMEKEVIINQVSLKCYIFVDEPKFVGNVNGIVGK